MMRKLRNLAFAALTLAALACTGCENDDTDFSDIIDKAVTGDTEVKDDGATTGGGDTSKGGSNATTVTTGSYVVNVAYSGDSAQVSVSEDVSDYLTVSISGADVKIVQSSSLSNEVTYTLSGQASDGMFCMDGELKATVVLNGLTLSNADGPAINIENGKRIAVQIADGTVNTLADGSSGTHKGCMMVNGHAEFEGSGVLNLTGNLKHAFWSDEYVLFKKSTGTINVLGAARDGFNVNQHMEMNGGTLTVKNVGDDGIQVNRAGDGSTDDTGAMEIHGGTIDISVTATAAKGIKAEGNILVDDAKSTPTLTITTTGGGEWDNDDRETSASSCIKSNADVSIGAGTLSLTSTGAGGKGIKAGGSIDMAGGQISVATKGTQYVYGNNRSSSSYTSSPKGIKAAGDLTISGGTIGVTTWGTNGEGIESKAALTITDGVVTVMAYDDAINSAGNMYLKGGSVTAYSTTNDGLDSNSDMYISGGTIVAMGAGGAETGIDIDERHKLYISGGKLFGIGGRIDATLGSTTQGIVGTTGSVSSGSAVSVSSGNTTLATFTMPGSCTNGAIMVSAEGMSSGNSYTLKLGNASSTLTASNTLSSAGGGPGNRPGGGGWGR